MVGDLCSPMCRFVDGGSGRGLGTENRRDDLRSAAPGDTVRPPIVTIESCWRAQLPGWRRDDGRLLEQDEENSPAGKLQRDLPVMTRPALLAELGPRQHTIVAWDSAP